VTEEFLARSDTYNIARGGRGPKEIQPSTRKKMSENNKGSRNPMFGATHSEESRKKISETRKARGHACGSKNPMFGRNRKDLGARNSLPKRWINKDGRDFLILAQEVDDYLFEGYTLGRVWATGKT
jgi:hypothetical protein